MEIREVEPADWEAIWPFFREIVAAGDTYAYDPEIDRRPTRELWMPAAAGADRRRGRRRPRRRHRERCTPNRPGPGAHVATASFMVDPASGGRGIGRALAERVIEWARADGFRAIQFNAVVETNAAAVALWRSLGFEIVGTVPGAFRLPDGSFVGLHVMHRELG